MSIQKLVNQAREMLEILGELEKGKAYDLKELGGHIGVSSNKELLDVVGALRDQGCIEIINGKDDSGEAFTAVALRSQDFDPGLVVTGDFKEKDEKKGGIVDANIGFFSGSVEEPQKKAPRIDIEFKSPPSEKALPRDAKDVGDLTIEQVLLQLADAVEQSDGIDDPVKYPLLEKIRSVASHPAILAWLRAPLRELV